MSEHCDCQPHERFSVTWHEIPYDAGFELHRLPAGHLSLHSTVTEMWPDRYVVTVWSVKGSDVPLVKMETRGDENRAYLAVVTIKDCECVPEGLR